MDTTFPTGLRHVLEVYRHARVSHRSRVNAIKEVSRSRRVDPQTVTSACTRSLGINTDELDDFLLPGNAKAFCQHLVRRFPPYQKEIERFFSQIEGKQDEPDDDQLAFVRALFPDEKKDLIRLLLLHDVRTQLSRWSERDDIPDEIKSEMLEMTKRIGMA